MNIDRFIDIIFDRVDEKVSSKDILFAKRSAVDSLAALYAGSAQSNDYLYELCSINGFNTDKINISDLQCSTLKSLIIGIASHSAELDDGVISGIIHPGSPIISSIICHGPNEIKSCLFYKAIIIGYEVCTLFSELIQPNHKMRGYHATATCGIFGAVVALSLVNGHDKRFCINVLNVAANYAMGSLSALQGQSNLKAVNVGLCTQIAISSYMLTKAGFIGPKDSFWGKFGFFDRMFDGDIDIKTNLQINELAVSRVYNKPYASCRYCHPSIDCILTITKRYQVELDEISRIEVETYELAIENHDHVDIDSTVSAKMSIPYSISTALINNKAGLSQYTPTSIKKVNDSNLMSKIYIKKNESYSQMFPENEPAKVKILLFSGKEFEAEIQQPTGSFQNPMSDEEIRDKLLSCADFADIKNVDSISEMLWSSDVISLNFIRDTINFHSLKTANS